MSAPQINYQNYELRGFELAVDASHTAQSARLSFNRLTGKPIDMYRTGINFKLAENGGAFNMKVLRPEDALVFHAFANLAKEAEATRLSLNPDSLILNGNNWNIPADNQISIETQQPTFQNFVLSRDQQQFKIESNTERQELAANFQGFRLAALFSLLNSTESPIDGQLNGQLRLLNLDQTPAFAT
ncbi:MAG: hypothetical protein U5L96_20290 [Owenweeksia sp.]|nr:hypothetical protein [Owenweeksia sp.]